MQPSSTGEASRALRGRIGNRDTLQLGQSGFCKPLLKTLEPPPDHGAVAVLP